MLLLACLLPSVQQPYQPWFEAPEVLNLYPIERLVQIGDFNGDGSSDLLALNFDDSTVYVRVLQNDGLGNFTGLAPSSFPNALNKEATASAGDVDGDGDLDLLVTATKFPYGGQNTRLFLGQGNGTFGAAIAFGSTTLFSATLAQLDGDAQSEVAVWSLEPNGERSLAVWEWNSGALALTSKLQAQSAGYLGLNPIQIDGSGVDRLIGDVLNGQVALWSSTGGQLSAPLLLQPVKSFDILKFDYSSPASAGDLDGDGDRDLVFVATSGSSLLIDTYHNNGTGGFSSLNQQVVDSSEAFVWSSPWRASTRLMDFDADGILDLVGVLHVDADSTADQTTYSFFLPGLPGGQFAAPRFAPERLRKPIAGVADLNGDGRLEVITATAILWGGSMPFTKDLGLPTSTKSVGLAWDIDQDGDVDLGGGGVNWSTTFQANDGAGNWSVEPTAAPGSVPVGTASFASLGMHLDLDGDGREDMVGPQLFFPFGPYIGVQLVGLWRYERRPGLGYAPVGPVGPAYPFEPEAKIFLAEINGDGLLDIVDGKRVWYQYAGGNFTGPSYVASNKIIDVADVDADGDVDLLTIEGFSYGPTYTLRLERATQAGYVPEVLLTKPLISTAKFMDLDEDGDMDLAVGYGEQLKQGSGVLVLGNTAGSFALSGTLPHALQVIGQFAAEDLDEDGRLDLLALADAEGDSTFPSISGAIRVLAWRRSNGLAFDAGHAHSIWPCSALTDVDSDGDLDAVGTYISRGLRVKPPFSGSRLQYGQSSVGAGGAKPQLGATGPFQPASTDVTLRLTGGLGGAGAFLVLGTQAGLFPNFPVPGVDFYLGGNLYPFAIQLGGTPGAVGDGSWIQPVLHPANFAGQTWHHQVFVIDPAAPQLISATNGLSLTYGI